VPVNTVEPPTLTVMKILAMNASPIVGTTPVSGAITEPANPASAAPTPNVPI
jgi:hypothetical protein